MHLNYKNTCGAKSYSAAVVVAKNMDLTSSFFPKGRAYTGALLSFAIPFRLCGSSSRLVTKPVSKDFLDFEETMTQPIPRSHVNLARAFEIFIIRLPTVFIVH